MLDLESKFEFSVKKLNLLYINKNIYLILEIYITRALLIVLLIIVLVRTAFITLLEQKILASIQIRIGPNKRGYWGILQPFADAIKLFNKQTNIIKTSNIFIFLIAPTIALFLALLLWILLPFYRGFLNINLAILIFVALTGLRVYPIIIRRWASNCKYSILGGLRAVAQIISYEVSLIVILLNVVIISASFNFYNIIYTQIFQWNLTWLFPIALVWFASRLAETNRTPYDFAEGESELVSGFNTEYRSGGFAIIFIAEYANILFISFLFSILFISSSYISFIIFIKIIFISSLFIWVRATYPRYRYDKLINLAWKTFLPVTLNFLLFSYILAITFG